MGGAQSKNHGDGCHGWVITGGRVEYGIIIMCGHIVLAIPNDYTFFIGLILVVLGTGLLKPNIGAMVGQLYASDDNRRAAPLV